ncbi:hypothetical protein RF11_10606 [Thelohanellus kitauei]|uniref:Uncharacterized protein n=1 Tax=Thelohanellus kitauei TaxID=669202 RepID=A0A0C2N2W3_THEKT|nr:hypothetical protein RF11_10606 [Thelohanellus kitauei]
MADGDLKEIFVDQIDSLVGFLKLRDMKNRSLSERLISRIQKLALSRASIGKNSIQLTKPENIDESIKTFFSIISDESADLQVTTFMLRQIYTLISLGVFDNRDSCRSYISDLTDTLNSTKFVTQSSLHDEAILYEILEIFKIAIRGSLFEMITDQQMCACLETCFAIFFNTKLNSLVFLTRPIAPFGITDFVVIHDLYFKRGF